MIRQIKLTRGKVVLVDEKDYGWLNQWKWFAYWNGKNYYATRSVMIKGKRYLIFMHREILGLKYKDGKISDHIDRVTMNNSRANLRVVDYVTSNQNQKRQVNNTSGYVGISWHKSNKKWQAYIGLNSYNKHLGSYSNVQDAVEARRQGEIKYWGFERW